MFLGRILAICSALMLVSGCSHLFRGPAQYASLPQTEAMEGDPGRSAAPHSEKPAVSRRFDVGVNPFATLQRSAVARSKWEAEPSPSYSPESPSPSAGTKRGGLVDLSEPVVTASLTGVNKDGVSAQAASQNYDGETVMSHLFNEGTKAAKPICVYC